MRLSPTPPAPDSRRIGSVAILFAGFVVTGILTTLLGPILPLLIARWSLSDADAGFFFTLQFAGNLAGLAALGVLLAQRGYRFTLSLGFALMAAGAAALMTGGRLQAQISTLVFGSGLGLTISGVNLWVGEDVSGTSGRRAAALSLLNMTWGLGAVACPPLVLLAQRRNLLPALVQAIAALCGVAALLFAARGVEPRASHAPAGAAATDESPGRARILGVMGGMFFIYMGTEASVAGWAAALAERLSAARSDSSAWTLAPMFFWAGLLTGRALVPLVLKTMTERALLVAGLALASAGTGALLLISGFAGVALCVALAGLGLACVYPLLVAWMLAHLGARARRSGNMMFALGCAGGATLPWLVGYTSSLAASLRAGLLVPLGGCLVMLGLLTLLRRTSPA